MTMLTWFQDHPVAISLIAGASAVLFVLGLLAMPFIARRIPADYFAHERRPESRFVRRHWLLRLSLLVMKNLLAVILIVAGIAMLVLPGQGLLTILVGFLLMDMPGKYRIGKWLIQRRVVYKPINWLRKRKGIEPLKHD
ncbi:MAG: hypothetical protein AB8C95_15850 [Phycisphaeraceae bacterium]